MSDTVGQRWPAVLYWVVCVTKLSINSSGERRELADYLKSRSKLHRNYSTLKRFIDWCLLLLAISLAALVVTNIGTKLIDDADTLSGITGAVAVILALLRIGRFQEQARWNKLKQRKLESLYRRLVFEGAEAADVSADLTKIDEELEKVRIWLEAPEDPSFLARGANRAKATLQLDDDGLRKAS